MPEEKSSGILFDYTYSGYLLYCHGSVNLKSEFYCPALKGHGLRDTLGV